MAIADAIGKGVAADKSRRRHIAVATVRIHGDAATLRRGEGSDRQDGQDITVRVGVIGQKAVIGIDGDRHAALRAINIVARHWRRVFVHTVDDDGHGRRRAIDTLD